MDKKFVGFLALAGGILTLLGNFIPSISKYPLILIGGIIALIAGLLGLFARY